MVPKSKFRKINLKIWRLWIWIWYWNILHFLYFIFEYESDTEIFLYVKSNFRQFGAKIKISSDLLENVNTSQYEEAECEFYWF